MNIEAVLRHFENIPTAEIGQELSNKETFSRSDLLEIARRKNVGQFCRGRPRIDVVDVIVKMGYASDRGYALLRGLK